MDRLLGSELGTLILIQAGVTLLNAATIRNHRHHTGCPNRSQFIVANYLYSQCFLWGIIEYFDKKPSHIMASVMNILLFSNLRSFLPKPSFKC